MPEMTAQLEQLGWLGGVVLLSILVGYPLHRLAWWGLGRLARTTTSALDDKVIRHARRPTALLPPAVVLYVLLPVLRDHLDQTWTQVLDNGLKVVVPVAVGWTLIGLTRLSEDWVRSHYDIEAADNLEARAMHTRIRVIRRVVVVLIAVVTAGVILMSIESLRQLGTGLLASAGLAGVILGFAAQRTLANLLAGIQIALTQPIRLDDVVVVEGEWGRIEEITLTYVVVRIWDQRRLVLPISYFIDHPFENWTRVSADILGTVYLHLDHRVPVDAIREELQRVVADREDWDGRVAAVVVTDTSPEGIAVRALVSASDSGRAWDLRCHVRERLVAFVRENYPESLPRIRAELPGPVAGTSTSS